MDTSKSESPQEENYLISRTNTVTWNEKEIYDDGSPSNRDWILINVGGRLFNTTRHTLTVDKDSMLAKMFSEESSFSSSMKDPRTGAYLLDRDPDYFAPILNYLRTGKLFLGSDDVRIDGILEEAEYFQVQSLIELLQPTNRPDLTRREIIKYRKMLSFQGLRLMGVDFSRLGLQGETFDRCNLRSANFENADLRKASVVNAEVEFANFANVDASDAPVFLNSNLRGCIFTAAQLTCANFCRTNLQQASFHKAKCESVLFQKANLRGACFEDALLDHAKFHDADLRECNFKGAKVAECHFTKADLRGATMDWDWKAMDAYIRFAKVTKEQYDSIPLSIEKKSALNLQIYEDVESINVITPDANNK